jgi:hypothetical protein
MRPTLVPDVIIQSQTVFNYERSLLSAKYYAADIQFVFWGCSDNTVTDNIIRRYYQTMKTGRQKVRIDNIGRLTKIMPLM